MRPQTLIDMAREKGTRLPPHLLDLDPLTVPADARGWFRFLDEVEVAVVPGAAFGPSGFIRLSYALADDDLVEGVGRIQELLSEAR